MLENKMKEDLKKQIIRCVLGECDYDCKYYDKTDNACNHEPLARKINNAHISEWIPCSEKLPEDDGVYLITSRVLYKTEVQYVFYQKSIGMFICNGKAIAWMPLPEPYRKE